MPLLIAAATLAASLSAAAVSAGAADDPLVLEQRILHAGPQVDGSALRRARDYWTAERIRNARPLPLVSSGESPRRPLLAPAPGDEPVVARHEPGFPPTVGAAARGASDRGAGATASAVNTRIEDAREYPLSTNGRLLVRYRGYAGFCSGTSITTPSHRIVLTAGHCVLDPKTGQWGHFAAFVPAYSWGKRPFGTFLATRAYVTERWARTGSPKYDVGAFVVDGKRGRLADVVGARGVASGKSRHALFQIFGYPAGAAAGEFLRECDGLGRGPDLGIVQRIFPGPPTVKSGCQMARGSSGGAWVVEDQYVNGLTSYGNRAMQIRSPYFGNYIWRFLHLLP